MVSNRSFPENMKRMQEAATEQAKAMQARSQQFRNTRQKSPMKNSGGEKNSVSQEDKKSEVCGKDESKHVCLKNEKSSGKNNFSNILNLLESLINDGDNTLIIVLILLLMDDENNFLILMVLFYLLT